jgi:CxxC motif-containing protein (DUF1111 family)
MFLVLLLAAAIGGTPDGSELFTRRWQPSDPRSAVGDGPGPQFNDVSCAACHHQGAIGGAGGNDHNVRLQVRSGRTEVVHAFGGSPGLGPLGTGSFGFFGRLPARATPALFGAGLLDAVTDAEILARANVSDPTWPEVSGRVGRDDAGRIARFGWKGHVADLASFVEQACANELGLELESDPASLAWDLDVAGLATLTGFVAELPPPVEDEEVPGRSRGAEVFELVGCASCHTPTIGGIAGVYSDLLLHDLGAALADDASGYGGGKRIVAVAATEGPAQPGEWRTPPLWGVRDSGPWLHDGRAKTLGQAIALHDGEARDSAATFAAAPAPDRLALVAFLDSLSAP